MYWCWQLLKYNIRLDLLIFISFVSVSEDVLLLNLCWEVLKYHWLKFLILHIKSVPCVIELPLALHIKIARQEFPLIIYCLHGFNIGFDCSDQLSEIYFVVVNCWPKRSVIFQNIWNQAFNLLKYLLTVNNELDIQYSIVQFFVQPYILYLNLFP